MPVALSVKNVPDDLAAALRRRAAAHHRSLQGELLAILTEAAGPPPRTLEEVLAQARRSGLRTGDEATADVRKLRDER